MRLTRHALQQYSRRAETKVIVGSNIVELVSGWLANSCELCVHTYVLVWVCLHERERVGERAMSGWLANSCNSPFCGIESNSEHHSQISAVSE